MVARREVSRPVAAIALALGMAGDREAAQVCSGARPLDLGEVTELDPFLTVVLLRELLARHIHRDHPVIALLHSQLVTDAQLAAFAA